MAKVEDNYVAADSASSARKSLGTIGGITILSTLVATGLSFFGSSTSSILIIITTAITTIVAVTIFYFIPTFSENVVLAPVPDLIFVTSVLVMAINLRSQSSFLLLFLIVILAISAFSKELWAYSITFLASVVSLLTVYAINDNWRVASLQDIVIQGIELATFGVLFGILAIDTHRLKRKELLESEKTKELMAQKRDIYLMIDNLSEGIIAVDQDRNITLMNKCVTEILGLEKRLEHYVGKNIDDVFISVSEEGKTSVVESSIMKNSPEIRNDLKIIRNDLTVKLHTESRPIIDDHNKPVGAIVLFRDITAQSELEEQRSEFLAIASHELRTPLTVIEGYLYYLMSDKALKYDKKTSEYIEKTYSAAEDLIHLSNDILAVVKSDEGHLVVNLEKTDIKKIILDTQVKFKDKAKKQGIKILVEVPDNLPLLMTDQQKITEVLTNLTENALKFTDKGSLTLRAELHDKQEIITSVIDTGIGISKPDQGHIFKKFYRTEDWQTRKTGGTGLGLYIAKTYLTRLGGKIGVKSTKGSGSTFWFSLPLSKSGKNEKKQDVQLHEFINNI